MHTKTQLQSDEIKQQAEETQRPANDFPPARRLFTLKKFAERYSDFITLSAITNQVFKAETRISTKGEIPGNGMLEFGVIVRNGRRVLIDADAYFRWLDARQMGPESCGPARHADLER